MGDHHGKCTRGDSTARESCSLMAEEVPHVEGRRSLQACEYR